jgi:hypothetical protein
LHFDKSFDGVAVVLISCGVIMQEHLDKMHREQSALELLALGPIEDGLRSPSQMTDETSSRGNSPRARSRESRRTSRKKGVGFADLEDDAIFDISLPTIQSVSSMEEMGEDSVVLEQTSCVEPDVPGLCIDNIRTVYNQATTENRYHVSVQSLDFLSNTRNIIL